MINLLGYKTLPSEILSQIIQVVTIWKKHVDKNLVGIYLHGSIVLNAFNPNSGDIDILVVVKNSLSKETKLAIAKDIIAIDKKPRPLEMSAVKLCDVLPWVTPGNCVFHYSDYWTERYLKRLSDPSTECYVVDQEFPDADVTSYIKLINQCGVVLYGSEIKDVFSPISDEDFWEAITTDVDDYDFHDYDTRYFTSNILILGRILSFRILKKILSKYEAGLWMIDYVPVDLKYIPEQAMKIWFEGEDDKAFPEKDLKKLKDFLIGEIKK